MLSKESRETHYESTKEPTGAKKLSKSELSDKFKAIDASTSSLLHGIVNRLGHLPHGDGKFAQYILSVDFEEALKDLLPLLQTDEGPILFQLTEMQIIERHLAPMLKVLDRNRFETAVINLLNLLLLLTTSNEDGLNRLSRANYLDCRIRAKKSFEDVQLMESLLSILLSCVKSSAKGRRFEGELEIRSKIFQLIRNVLSTPDPSPTSAERGVFQMSIYGYHHRITQAMNSSGLLDFLMVAAASCNDDRDGDLFSPHAILLIEIFHCLFRVYNPDSVALIHLQDGSSPAGMEEEFQREGVKIKRPIRHCRFSGTLVFHLSTGEDYVMTGNISNADPESRLDRGKRVQHKLRKMQISEFGNSSSTLRPSDLTEILKISGEFMKDAFVELVKYYTDALSNNVSNSEAAWNILGLVTWFLRFGRNLLTKEGESAICQFSFILPAISPQLMVTFARLLRRSSIVRQIPLLLAGVIYFREALRLYDLISHLNFPVTLKDALRAFQMEFFHHEQVVGVFRLLLNNSKNLSMKMLSILFEANHVLLKLLKAYCSQKGHIFMINARGIKEKELEEDSENENENSEQEDYGIGSEKEFIYQSFIAEYCTENIADSIIRCLRSATSNDCNTNRNIAMLIQRIIKETKCIVLFYRASFLEAINSCLVHKNALWRHENDDLIKICTMVATRFIEALKEDPNFIVKVFFRATDNAKSLRAQSNNAKITDDITTDLVAIPVEWDWEEKVRWLLKCLVEAEEDRAVNWLIGVMYDAAAARKLTEEGRVENFHLLAQTDTLKESFKNAHFKTLLTVLKANAPTEETPNWHFDDLINADKLIEYAAFLQTAIREEHGSINHNMEPNREETLESRISSSQSDESDNLSDQEAEEQDDSIMKDRSSSKWSQLKRSHFFLTRPDEESSIRDQSEVEEEELMNKKRRAPLRIESDSE